MALEQYRVFVLQTLCSSMIAAAYVDCRDEWGYYEMPEDEQMVFLWQTMTLEAPLKRVDLKTLQDSQSH